MRLIERRIGLLFAGFLLAFLVVVTRAFWLQGVQGSQLATQAVNQQTETVMVPGLRGSLLDRSGNLLASSEDAATIYATPYQVKKKPQAAKKIAAILDLKQKEVLEALSEESGFAYIAHKVPLTKAMKIEKLHLEGIGQLPDSRRVYPQGEMAGQVIGVIGSENTGLTGLEEGEESVLGGTDGERRVVRDALGDPIRLETVKQAEDGEDIQLTLDPVIQQKTEEVLAGVGESYSPKGATAIVVDPRTSQILAMANWPPVNPGEFEEASNEELMNQATSLNYEPGSTFKAFTVAAALEEKLVTPTTEFTLAPQIRVADRTIEDAEERGTENMTVAQILAKSSNVGAVTIGLEVGEDKFSKWIEKFGFDKPTKVQFPNEEVGIVPKLSEWSGSTIGNVPIGQGIAVTPVQMIAAYGAIANRGVLIEPHLVDRVGNGERVQPVRRRVVSTKTAEEVRHMLREVVEEGSGTAAQVPGYRIAGKTGTAAKPDGAGGYSTSAYVASFVGFVPAKHPRLVILVTVDEPRGAIWGGVVAAPAFAEIAKFALQYLEIPPD